MTMLNGDTLYVFCGGNGDVKKFNGVDWDFVFNSSTTSNSGGTLTTHAGFVYLFSGSTGKVFKFQ